MPRKSTASNADAGPSASDGISVEDLALPRTMIQRLAKGVLPANTQIQKDALLALSKSATVFVNHLAWEANSYAERANKKTIQPKDVLDAMRALEFEGFMPRLEAELLKYNEMQCDKRNTYRRRVKDEQQQQQQQQQSQTDKQGDGDAQHAQNGAEAGLNGDGADTATGQHPTADGGEERAAKKIKADGGTAVPVSEGQGNEEDDDEVLSDDNGADEDASEGPSEGEDDDVESDEEGDEDPNDQLREDPLEEREDQGIGDEALDGDESD